MTIKLPPPEIFETALDDESGCTHVYAREAPPLMSPSVELDSEVRQRALDSFRQTALENGILERTPLQGQPCAKRSRGPRLVPLVASCIRQRVHLLSKHGRQRRFQRYPIGFAP